MVTSSAARVAQPGIGDVVVVDWQEAGLLRPSVVRTGRLLVIERQLVSAALGDLAPVDLQLVDVALKTVLGISE